MASMVEEMRRQEMMRNAGQTGTRLEPYVNHRAPNPPPSPMLKAIGYNPDTLTKPSTALATVPQRPNFIMGESAEYKAAQAAKPRVDLSGYTKPTVNPATGAYTDPRVVAKVPSQPLVQAAQSRGMLSKINGVVPRGLAGAGTALGVGMEGAKVAETAMAPTSTGMDIAEQVAESSGRLAAGGLGAKAGAALGALGGPAAPITVPVGAILGGAAGYFGAGKLASMGREAMGSDGREAVDRVAPNPLIAAAQAQKAAPQATYSNEGRNSPATVQQPRQAPSDAAPTNPLATEVRPGIFRQGNSFSDSAAGASAGAKPSPISAQNMAAADALAARYAPTQTAQPQAQMNQNITPQTSGSGYGLLDAGARDRRNAMMDVQQAKPGSGTALKSLLQQQAEAPGQQLARDRLAQDGQNSAADRLFRSNELVARAGESAADRALKSQELADSMKTNAVKRDAAGIELTAAQRLQALQGEYLNAKTPEEQKAAVDKINALSGKTAANQYMAVNGGETVIDNLGNKVRNPDILVNMQTGLPVNVGQGAKPAQEAGMPSANHIEALRQNPQFADKFDARYGKGAAAKALGK